MTWLAPGEICLDLGIRTVSGELFSEIDAWLRVGGLVVTASERAARFQLAEHHRVRRAEGLSAWKTPEVEDWQSFARSEWEKRNFDGRLILTSLQEQSLWAGILAGREPSAKLLEGPRYRVADLAISAHQLICAYAPQFLNERARRGWQQDAAEFSVWLAEFDEICRIHGFISSARVPLELIDLLEKVAAARPPILLAGFDRVLPTQRRVFAAWGDVREALAGQAASLRSFHRAADPASELAACAIWCRRQLATNANARLLVVAQDVAKRRGEFERAFLRYAGMENGSTSAGMEFEFSLGVSLAETGLVRSASLLLHWLTGSIQEHEVDWLFSSQHTAANGGETQALMAFMRALRDRKRQRTRWTLEELLRQGAGAALPAAWISRMRQARHRLLEAARRPQARLTWAELAARLLELAAWPGSRPLSSVEFQILQRWQRTVDDSASLGFNGKPVVWNEFLADLDRAARAALFASESQGAPILIAGAAESAGLTADAIWFSGADEENWPARGATHPLLPIAVQREAGMPHASAQADWDLAAVTTRRILASAPQVEFSYARQAKGVDKRPSRLIQQLAGEPQPMPETFSAPPATAPLAAWFADESQIPFPSGEASGGSGILTSQSRCAFKAFATARLGARDWEPAQTGLTPAERGSLLHEVMHRIWAGPPAGVRTHAELVAISDLEAFVAGHVREALAEKMPARARDSMPSRYLELEGERLAELIAEWLLYEQSRVPFAVEQTEAKASPAVGGLKLNLRLDRVDRLNDGSLLVIDYKSGEVKAGPWDLPRPEDVQLPLYAEFGLDHTQGEVGGLVLARLRAGECKFEGKVRHARGTLRGDLNRRTNLVQKPLTPEDMAAWRGAIEQLAEDFLAGRSDVNPRNYPETCEWCGLQSLCRIQEMQGTIGHEDADSPESSDE